MLTIRTTGSDAQPAALADHADNSLTTADTQETLQIKALRNYYPYLALAGRGDFAGVVIMQQST